MERAGTKGAGERIGVSWVNTPLSIASAYGKRLPEKPGIMHASENLGVECAEAVEPGSLSERELAVWVFQKERSKESRFRVLLRHAETGLYYAAAGQWVGSPALALDFESTERAAEFGRSELLAGVQLILYYEDPLCELTLPL